MFSGAVKALGRIEMLACCGLLVLIVAIISFQIVARYAFNAPLAWMEELATYAFIWLVMIGSAVAAKEHRHIVVDLFPKSRLGKKLGFLMVLTSIVTLIVILLNAVPIVIIELRTSSVSLPVNFPKAWFFSIPLIYALCSILLSLVLDLFTKSNGAEA